MKSNFMTFLFRVFYLGGFFREKVIIIFGIIMV